MSRRKKRNREQYGFIHRIEPIVTTAWFPPPTVDDLIEMLDGEKPLIVTRNTPRYQAINEFLEQASPTYVIGRIIVMSREPQHSDLCIALVQAYSYHGVT